MSDEVTVDPDGLWQQVPAAAAERLDRCGQAQRPALFLDRDGVINEEVGYLSDPDDLRLIAGSAEAVAEANHWDIPVVVVTNQGGVGRGQLTWDEFARVQRRLSALLAERDAELDMVLACPFHEAGEPPYRHPEHPDRKPRPGMLHRAAARLCIDLSRSWIVGDSARDMRAGHAAGLAGGVLVATGHGLMERPALSGWAPAGFNLELHDSLAGCRSLLIERLKVTA